MMQLLQTPEIRQKRIEANTGVSTAVATSTVALPAMSEQEAMDLVLPVNAQKSMRVGEMNYIEFCDAMERLLGPLSRRKRLSCRKHLFGNASLNLDHSDVRWWVLIELKKLGVKYDEG